MHRPLRKRRLSQCDRGLLTLIAGTLKRSADSAHAALLAGALPGVLVVPAGVMAISACREAKFTYIQSSL